MMIFGERILAELSDQNNGKASMLVAATRTVKDMLDQIERLRKENATLLSESKYVTHLNSFFSFSKDLLFLA